MTKKMPKHWTRKIDGIYVHQLWDLRSCIVRYVLPRLKAFKKMKRMGWPGDPMNPEEWETILDKMVEAFELIHKDDKGDSITDAEWKKVTEGWDLFHKYFWQLWD